MKTPNSSGSTLSSFSRVQSRLHQRSDVSGNSSKQVSRLLLCIMLAFLGVVLSSGSSSTAPVHRVASPAPQSRTSIQNLKAEAPQISNGAVIDQEIQNHPKAFDALQQTTDDAGPRAEASVTSGNIDPYAPPLGGTFDGINFNEDANLTGFFQIPPDPSGAAGPTHVVNVVNSAIEWYTKAGLRQNRQTLSSFFASAPTPPQTRTFDPKVIYDQYENRFVVATMEMIEASGMTPNQSRVYFAVSDDSDPNGTWRFVTVTTEEVISGRQTWADFPGLSVDADAIYYTNNQFAHNNQTQAGVFQGQRLRIIAKQPFYAGGAAVFNSYDPSALANANAGLGNGDGAIATTMQPTQMYGDLPGGLGTFLIAYSGINDFVSGSDANLFVQVIQVDNPLTAPTFTGYFSQWGTIQINDNLFSGFPGAPQATTTRRIATNDRRFSQHGVYRNGLLYCAAPVLLPASSPEAGQVTAHWFVINPVTIASTTTDPPPTDQGDIGGESIAPGTYTFFPSVAVDGVGNLAVGFAASGPGIFAGSYFTGRLAADAAGTTQPPSTLRPGQDRYIRDFTTSMTVTSRWGDYTGIWVDPGDDLTFWVYNEHALLRGTILGGLPEEDGRWGTAWGSFSLSTPATPTTVPLLISEFRNRGPAADGDEFIEIYNPTNTSQTVIAIDGSGGYSVVAEDGGVRCIISNGTVIPAFGHFLCAGPSYSLSGYPGNNTRAATADAVYFAEISDTQGIALFNNATPLNFTLANRLDAFGYSTSPALYREGTGYPFVLTFNTQHTFFRKLVSGLPQDTGNNASDFQAVNATPDLFDYGFPLGAPGPENLGGPIHDPAAVVTSAPLDPTAPDNSPPNAVYDATSDPGNNSTFGTVTIRRTFTNSSTAPINRLRFRITDITTRPASGTNADLRARTSVGPVTVTISGANPACAGSFCSVQSTTLEEPPAQVRGGGFNSSLRAGTIALATPLAVGGSINLSFLLGVEKKGTYNFAVSAEALPGANTTFSVSGCAGVAADCPPPTPTVSTLQFDSPTYAVVEACTVVTGNVSRTGPSGSATSINVVSVDGSAKQKGDFNIVLAHLVFAPGEVSKQFQILINDDGYTEGVETATLVLQSPQGSVLGASSAATLQITDNSPETAANPIDNSRPFVCQQYHDFLYRQSDPAGEDFWTNQIEACGADAACREAKRVDVSTAFFLSIEFQQSGYFVIRAHKAAFGNSKGNPRYAIFLPDQHQINEGVIVGQGAWAAQLAANQQKFLEDFVSRPEFTSQASFAPGAAAATYVDALFANAGVTPTTDERNAAIAAYGSGDLAGRTAALRSVIDTGSLFNALYNPAFVLMQYYGYLRRNPDDLPDNNFNGYDFWLAKMDSFTLPGEDARDEEVALSRVRRAEMVKAFVNSIEYRERFFGAASGNQFGSDQEEDASSRWRRDLKTVAYFVLKNGFRGWASG